MKILILFIIFLVKINGKKNENAKVEVDLKNQKFILEWNPNFDQQFTTFELTYSNSWISKEWVFVGFSDHGEKIGSDFCLFYFNKIFDGFIDEEENLKFDLKQDCHFVVHDKTKRKIVFQKKFATCDVRDYAVEIGTTQFLFAFGLKFSKKLNLKDSDVFYDFRFNQILQAPIPVPPDDPDAQTLEIRANNARVPNVTTTYWCAIVKLDESLRQKKHHIIKMEPLITAGNKQLVHHMEIFHCVNDSDADTEYNGNCNSNNKPKMTHMCSRVLAAWAQGASAVVYPVEAGLPFGGPDFRPLVMVEIHYNNPQHKFGIIDNSGFKFTFTTNLRPNDAGIMELGLIYSDTNSIPPGQTAFPMTGYCVADCTNYFPKKGIHIFSTQLHAHLTGKKLWTSHYRNGIKIGEINRDNHYSPHWQHIQTLQKHVHVLPGDVLTTTCVYNTKNKQNFVFGGYEIENEMCVNYIYYYPTSKVEVCKSAVDNSTLQKWFKSKGIEKTLLIHQKYQKLETIWNQKLNFELLELYSTGKLNMACLDKSGNLFKEKNWTKIPQPETFAGTFDKTRAFLECPALND